MNPQVQEEIHDLVTRGWLLLLSAQNDGVDVHLRDIVDGLIRSRDQDGSDLLDATKHELMVTGLATYFAQNGDQMPGSGSSVARGREPRLTHPRSPNGAT